MIRPDFESIVRTHQSMVYSIAYNFFGDIAVAEEIAQEVFLQLHENRQALKNDAHVKHWLRRAATHRSIDVLRRRGRRSEVQLDDIPEVAAPRCETDPLLVERLRRLVRSLPEKPRAVLILRYGEDMDVHEIGKILEMPVPTVWSHLRRSIAILRDKFASIEQENDHERLRT
jgi:RNA polymerase sigma-70 factor (ECF subfamily)